MTVEIVTHVYGPFYICLLSEQLRSLEASCHSSIRVVYTVVTDADCDTLLFDGKDPPHLFTNELLLDKPQLLNRTIGRNLTAKSTKADWVWFADADYLFGPGSLESVAALDPHAACMYWPRYVLRPPVDDWFDDWPPGIDPVERCTVPQKPRKAIGGCQIAPGHIARKYGYLDGLERHLQPAAGNEFLDTRGDKAVRGWLQAQTGLPILPADIPNVMRLRHRIPPTSQRHGMTLPEFRLLDGTEATIAADSSLSRD